MTLWFLMLILCSATAVAIAYPLIRRFENAGLVQGQDLAVYQDQLKEVDRDLESGAINSSEAASSRSEIERRIAKASLVVAKARPLSNGWRTVALISATGLVVLGGVNLYSFLGSPELASTSNWPATGQVANTAQQGMASQASGSAQSSAVNNAMGSAAGQVDGMITQLQAKLQANPNDGEGWRMLGWSLFNTQRYQESADAYAKALNVDPNNTDYKSALAESLVQAAQGIVTPKAIGLIGEVLAKDPKEQRARFYDALAHEQSGDQGGALDRWMSLYADAPADAAWRDDVKQRIADLAKATGRDVSAVLTQGAPAVAVQQKPLGSDEKDAMVAGMIGKLAAKLDANPKDRDGWAMMIRSLNVTGDKKGAQDALAKALEIFKDDKATTDGLNALAQSLDKPASGGAAGATASSLPPGASAPQISEEQKAAIQSMAPADQQQMIKGMVENLAAKLSANPNDLEGWLRLIRSYKVLNDPAKAKEAFDKANSAFSANADGLAQLKAAATELGIN
jgi:cytochrome c-type biogenesis protein CcmH